jgi:uncharacterized membrane protein
MSRRALVIALIVSVALNLFVVGGVAGAALMLFRMQGGPPLAPPHPPPTFAMAEDVGSQLTPEHREQWMTTLKDAAVAAGPRLRQSHDLRREAWNRLAADPVDTQAVMAELTRARDLELQARGDIDRAVVTFAGGLPADERKKVADKLSKTRLGGRMLFLRHGPDGGRGFGEGPGPGPGGPGGANEPPLPDR